MAAILAVVEATDSRNPDAARESVCRKIPAWKSEPILFWSRFP